MVWIRNGDPKHPVLGEFSHPRFNIWKFELGFQTGERFILWFFGVWNLKGQTAVVNKHGDRFRPQDLGLWDPLQMAMKMAYKWGLQY